MFTPFAFIQPITTAAPITPALNYVLIGGAFTIYDAPSTTRIAKINTNGDLILDSTFNIGTGFNSAPYDIKQQPDGKYVVAGVATSYSGSTISRVARLNQNGTLDTTFNPGTIGNTVRSIVTQPDNSNIIFGDFPTISGSSTSRYIAKLTPSGSLDATFNVEFGFNNQVYNAVTQSSGKIIAVGEFTQYYQNNAYITRTDLSGSQNAGLSTDFNTGLGFNSTVNTFTTQSDGKILVGGAFITYSGSSTNTTRIIRLNPNGTQDTSFVTGTGFNSSVYKILVQPDGKIVAAGAFTTYSGSSVSGITRLNTNGTIDNTFNVGTGLTGVGTIAIDALLQPDNKIVVGGTFTLYSGSTASRLVRINTNGTLDSTFNTGVGFDNNVNALDIRPDGKILAAGLFLNYSGSSRTYVVRLNDSGSYDTTFNIGTGPSNTVLGIAHEPGTNKIIIAGNFTTYSGSSTNTTRITRLNENGSQDTTFVTGTGLSSYNVSPAFLSVESDGKIYVGSTFVTYSGSTVNGFARINPSGTLDTTFVGQMPTTSSATGFNTYSAFISGSNIYFGGNFVTYRPTNYIVRINTDGTWDPTFAIGTGFNAAAYDLKVQPDDKIIVAGNFSTYSGSSTNTNRIIRLNADGTQDTSFNSGTNGFNAAAHDLDIQPDGKILAIGAFTSYSGSTNNYITRINSDGTRDTTFNVGTAFSIVSAGVNTMKILSISESKVMVTIPLVTSYSGSTSGNILRINSSGTLDTTFNPLYPNIFNRTGFGFSTSTGNPGGYTMIMSGSDVIVGGQFSTYKSPMFFRGGMIDSTGTISSSFNIGATGFDSNVRTWATQSDGKILAGGDFTQYSGSNITRIVRINNNGSRDTTFNVGTGFNSSVYNLLVQPDGKIIAVGNFTTYSGSSVSGIVRLNISGTIDNTFNVGAGFTLSTQGQHSVLQSDGKVIAVGAFTTYSGSASSRIVRINTDGTRDTTFNVGAGLNATTEAVLLQSDEKVVVTGNFTTYSGSSVNRIMRLNTDGTIDTTFNVGTGFTVSSGTALALQSDGKVICANLNQAYSGSTNRYIIRINTNGTLDTTFNANANTTLSQTSNTANSLKIANDGKIYWGNSFTTFSGSFTPNRIVRLNTNGSVDETFNQSFPNYANNTGKGADGTILAVLLL